MSRILRKTVVIFILFAGITGAQNYEVLRTFTEVLNQVTENYVDEKKSEELVYHAIQGILKSLDPHSIFLSPKQYRKYKSMRGGELVGFGLEVQRFQGKVYIQGIVDGTPAQKAGLKIGDVILQIDSLTISDTTSTTELELAFLGEEGTSSTLKIFRPSTGKELTTQITRDEYENSNISMAVMLSRGTFYMKIDEFGANLADEVNNYVDRINTDITKKIVIDLRGNPGGRMDQCFKTAEIFLSEGDTVYTSKGRKKQLDQVGVSKTKRITELPLIVLIDRNSASASEMLSGALQDNDRAILVGTNTFGKGLIQVPFDLRGGAGLVMTVGRYQTPSGRIIQKEYDNISRDEYYDLMNSVDSSNFRNGKTYRTNLGRRIYGGGAGELEKVGGIFPDVFVDYGDDIFTTLDEDSLKIFEVNFLNNFFEHFPDLKSNVKSFREFYTDYLLEEKVFYKVIDTWREKDNLISPPDYSLMLANHLKSEIARQVWGEYESMMVGMLYDKQLNYALNMSPEDINKILGSR